jgi:hypothetical protein
MLEYELNGQIYTEDQVNRAAGGADKAAEYIKRRGLKLVNRAASKSRKEIEPVKTKENVFGEVKEFDPFKTNKYLQPKKQGTAMRSKNERESGEVAPNQNDGIPTLSMYKKPKTSEMGIPANIINNSLKKPESVDAEIQKNDLDLKNPYLYYSNSKIGDDFVVKNYNEALLKKRGINIDDFDGFINRKKYKDDFIEKEQDGAFKRSWIEKLEDYGPDALRLTRSEEEVKFTKEKLLNNYLNLYLQDKDKRSKQLKMLEAKKANPNYDWEEIKKNTKDSYDWQSRVDDEYKSTVFPTIKKIEDEKLAKEKQLYNEVSKRGKVKGAIENTGLAIKSIGTGFWDTTQDVINTGLDLIGFDKEAEVGRAARDYEEYKNFDTRSHSYIKGKSIEKNGVKYLKDETGNIYDVTNGFNVGGLIDNAEYQKINEEIDAKGIEDWDVNARGSAKATGQVVGAMIPQILLTEATMGIGNAALLRASALKNGFTSVKQYKNILEASEAIGGTKALAKMPLGISKDMAGSIVSQSAFGYSNGYEQTLKAAKDAGINDKEAETLALNAGSKMAMLYAATAPLSPQTKARELIFGSAEQNLIKKALEAYKINGAKGFITNLTDNVKTAARATVGFVEEGGKEALQENVQQKLENEQVNANINELAGQKILKEDYTYQDFVNTSGLAFLSGGMIANAKIPNFKQDPKQQINNLVTLGQNPNSLSDHLDTMVANGTATAEEANQLKSDAIATVRQLGKIPKDIDAATTLDLVRKLEEVNNLESSKKEIAAPFHAPIDAKIEAINTEITTIYDKRLDTEVERLQTLTSQANAETFGEGAINEGQAYSVVSTKEETAKLAEEWFINNGREDDLYEQNEEKKFEIDENGKEKEVPNFVLDENGDKIKIDYKSEPAIVLPNGQIIINREIARQVDEGASAGRHELLHKILKSQFNDAAQSEKLLNQFRSVLSNKENAVIEQRLADRGYDAKYLSDNKDEYLTQFFEALEAGEIKATDATFKSMWKSLIRPIYKKLGFEKLDFESGNDIYQFLKDYHITSKAGKLTERQKTLLEAGKAMTGNIVSSKSVQERINDLYDAYASEEISDKQFEDQLAILEDEEANGPSVKAEPAKKETVKKEPTDNKPKAKTNLQNLLDTRYEGNPKKFASEGLRNTPSGGVTNDFSKSVIGKELGGSVETITRRLYDPIAADAKRGVTRDEYKDALLQSAALLISNEFDPSKQSLDKFISSRLNLRANALAYELGIEGATKGGIKKDVEDQKTLISEETAVEVKEKPKYKNALESKVFPTEVIESGNKKALAVVRTLKSRIDAPVSLNRTVTPLVGEIKDEMGKLLDIDIKTAMGGKKDQQLEKFLLKGKRYILENMTTTWLMGKDGQGGMPIAIQKQIDGKWISFPEWVGKKIDREKTTTDLAGRTSGAELVRRLPNVANNISDADFLAQVIGPDGNPLRGRKESLAKAMAEELAFELIKEDFENDGPILEAFSTNQERQGVEVTEVVKNEFEKQVDRGNVKFSKASNKAAALFLLKEGNWRKDYLPYTEFYKGLTDSEKRSLNGFLNGSKSLMDKYQDIWEKNAGVRYEKDIYMALRKANKYLTQVGLKLEENVPDRFNSQKNDLVVIDETNDNKTVIELKSNPRDPMGSTSNGNFINNDLTYKKEFTGLNDLKAAQKANTNRTEFINYLKQLIKEGSKEVRLTPNGIQISNALYKNLDRTGTTTNTEVNLQSLSDINSDKDILQIQNYGAFTFPGKSVGGISPITGKLFASSEFRTNSAGKGWRTLTERVYFYLDPNFNEKSDFNLDTDKGSVKVLDAIRTSAKLSKAKKDAVTNDAVTQSLTSYTKNPKGISVFDFDDTVGLTKGSVLYTMPDGTKGKLNAEEFAKEGGNMLDAGAEFDFSEFSKVVDGKPGPMVEKMKKMIGKFGPENFFILTARPANSAQPIHDFLSSIGIDIPLKNITGLGSSLAQSKADWMTAKAAEGYNDFYFADDAIQNVEAVKNALEVLDVKSKIQQARLKFSKTISPEFNKIIEENTGMENYKVFSDIVARRRGAKKNRFDFYVPPSAADFELLLYNFIGKGTRGEEQQKFFADALLKPYANGNDLMDAARQSIKNTYKELIKQFPDIKNKIEKLTPDGDFTYDQALRVAMWTEENVEIPGLSQRDQVKLVDLVNNSPELTAFKQALIVTGRQGKGWIAPTEYWDASTIISDLHNLTEGTGRKKFLAEFIDNVTEMFGKFENGKLVGPNMNKIEAVYGSNVREALEDQLYRMINGKNRSYGNDKETSRWSNWVNGSTGTIMFLNTRSAALQLIGAVNFLNLRDNNPVAAGIAFANQKQYWKDFTLIWNSDKMKERRGGLKEDVAAAEIANAAAGSKNKANSVISYLLKIGYTPTQLADSFAIASGGAPFYRNRIKSYLKEGLTQDEAETAAWGDFTKISDETQQSGDPRDISKQQASPAGRLLLTFQNTAMQQSRIVKKSVLDLKNGRGDAKTHVAKIIYYLGIQNTLFAVLQQGLFAVVFDDDDEEIDKEKEKAKKKTLNERLIDVADGVLDTILRGTGFLGGIVSVLKNMVNKYLDEKDKNFKADYAKVMLEGANISPPIGSKLRKVYTGLQQSKFEKDLIAERGWGVMQDGRVHLGPLYGVTGKLVEAGTNLPMDRLVNKIENVSQAMNSQNQAWQRIAVGVGFTPYSVGIEDTKGDLEIRAKAKEIRKKEGIEKGKKSRAEKAAAKKDSISKLSYDEQAKLLEARREKRRLAREKKMAMNKY